MTVNRLIIFLMISVSDINVGKIKTQNCFYSITFSRTSCLVQITWKIMVQPIRPQTKIWYGECALHTGYVKLQTHTQNMKYFLLFHSKRVTRKLLSITLVN